VALFDSIKRALGRTDTEPQAAAPRTPQPEEIRVPEINGADLMGRFGNGNGLLILDCREDYEWRQVRIPGSLHIPMRQIPERVKEIDRAAEVVVVCAHGNRSYGVAGWLLQNGYRAQSLQGGVFDWQLRGGQVDKG
jgi:rhodanese-related sulfurtransferase